MLIFAYLLLTLIPKHLKFIFFLLSIGHLSDIRTMAIKMSFYCISIVFAANTAKMNNGTKVSLRLSRLPILSRKTKFSFQELSFYHVTKNTPSSFFLLLVSYKSMGEAYWLENAVLKNFLHIFYHQNWPKID